MKPFRRKHHIKGAYMSKILDLAPRLAQEAAERTYRVRREPLEEKPTDVQAVVYPLVAELVGTPTPNLGFPWLDKLIVRDLRVFKDGDRIADSTVQDLLERFNFKKGSLDDFIGEYDE